MTDRIEVFSANTEAEAAKLRAAAADLSSFPHVRIIIGIDPDNPDRLRCNLSSTDGAPCALGVAGALRDMAEELELHHGDSPCDGSR